MNGIATSLLDTVGHRLSREEVLAMFCNELERLMKARMSEVMQEYKAYDILVGKSIRVHHSSREVNMHVALSVFPVCLSVCLSFCLLPELSACLVCPVCLCFLTKPCLSPCLPNAPSFR